MQYQEFLSKAVDASIKAATEDYKIRPEKKSHLEGSLAGLNACRDKSPPELAILLHRAREVHSIAFRQQTNLSRYWRVTCFMHEVEWVCNVVSVVLANQGMPPIIPPTVRAAMLAAQITNELGSN